MIERAPSSTVFGSVPPSRSSPAFSAHPYSSCLASRISRCDANASAVVNPMSSNPSDSAHPITSSFVTMGGKPPSSKDCCLHCPERPGHPAGLPCLHRLERFDTREHISAVPGQPREHDTLFKAGRDMSRRPVGLRIPVQIHSAHGSGGRCFSRDVHSLNASLVRPLP
ncbi:MAG: hypothetical protein BWZ01_03046 [Deltaproteobacteria bacterium ADurb.BinA179]|nr:MAG: hypothetical protein BWZ01_03046 [Deltaproteobacteria bacterium ADurb.BinA179]